MSVRSLAAAVAVAALAVVALQSPLFAQDDANRGPRCAEITATASWRGYGYTHVVALRNQCSRRVECEVWTNVDPTPRQTLAADAGESASVVTRGGSPGREVQPGYLCREQ